ncbi:MAG: DUF4118 domain-containing protein [Bryobacteraceae bacterium]|nr:DUF4118 domain-containing protein [Bryobacteraceae bacterium]
MTWTAAALSAERAGSERIRATVILGVVLSISFLHYIIPPALVHWHYILQRLFYLPVIYAALHFGWRGGLATAVFAGVFYSPLVLVRWQQLPYYSLTQYLEVIIFCMAGILTGVLADREREQRHMLQRRTQELSDVYRRLQDNFERMKRAERLYALGQLSAGLAHEIRNPLAGIEGAAIVLQRDGENRQRRGEFLEIIQKECRRLNRLLTNFLDFARPRPPAYQAVEVAPIIDSVFSLASHAAGKQTIRWVKDVEEGLPRLECDPEQVKQILLNLTINAVQAMPDGGELTLSARLEGDNVALRVKDEGSAASPENVDKLFDPFFTTKEYGTGLGLSVAHQIAVQHGGVLTAEKNPERGMTFTLVLPLRRGSII